MQFVFPDQLVLRLNEADNRTSENWEFNQACILVGSNIDPIQNCHLAIQELSQIVEIVKISSIWETQAIGSTGDNFLNFALIARTKFDIESLKISVLKPLEKKLGRVRSGNKNAPRTIDLDVMLFNGIIVDEKIWDQYFSALPVSELFPDAIRESSGKSLSKIASELVQDKIAIRHDELMDTIFS